MTRKETCPLCGKRMVQDRRFRKAQRWVCKNHTTPVVISIPIAEPVTSPPRTCAREGCQQTFIPEPNNPSQRFHSGACRQADYRQRKRLAEAKDA